MRGGNFAFFKTSMDFGFLLFVHFLNKIKFKKNPFYFIASITYLFNKIHNCTRTNPNKAFDSFFFAKLAL